MIVLSYSIGLLDRMGIKRIILVSAILFVSCASNPKGEGIAYSSSAINDLASDHTSVITSEIFDVLQRPLGFNLSSQFKPISRISWEYHMAGIGWWDIYFMSGKNLEMVFMKSCKT